MADGSDDGAALRSRGRDVLSAFAAADVSAFAAAGPAVFAEAGEFGCSFATDSLEESVSAAG